MTNCLAFDLGSSSGRAFHGCYENGLLRLTARDHFSTQSIHTEYGLQWDFYNLLERIKNNLSGYAREYESPLSSVGVDCCGDDYGLLDANGHLLGLPHNYRDSRTVGTEKIIANTMNPAEIYRCTGVHFMRHNTLNQIIAERDCREGLLERADAMLFLGDLFHYFLTGEQHIEYSGASITQMFNCNTRDWDVEILDAFNIPRSICKKTIEAGDIYGRLTADATHRTGINDGVLVITPPTHDSASAVVPIPMVEDGNLAYISSGTWSIIGLEIDRPIITECAFEFNISNSGTALGKLMFTKNIMGLWIIQQCRRIWEKTHPNLSFADIVELARQAKPFVAVVDPDDELFFDAPDIPAAIEGYLRETQQHVVIASDVGGIARVIYESLAFKYRYILNHMLEASGKQVDKLYIIGGGGNNELLNQFAANATAKQVVVSLPEATVVGNLMVQLYGLGKVKSLQEIREVVHRSFPNKVYEPQDVDIWDKQYEGFLELLRVRGDKSFS